MTRLLNKYILKKDRLGILFVSILGILTHFLYEWSGGNGFIALFCPVNESTWEHLKLLFFPYLLWSIWDYLHVPQVQADSQLYCRLLGVLCGMLSIVALFYTYTGVLGTHYLVIDILIFFIGVGTSFLSASYFIKRISSVPLSSIIYAEWALVCLCFFIFTGFPPGIPLFFAPVG